MKKTKRFEIIECAGTYYEIGRQMGEKCSENIHQAMQMTFGGLSLVNGTTKENIVSNALKLLPKVREFDPPLVEMLTGLAAGANTTFEEVFALKCGFDLGVYYNHLSSMCTSFAVTGQATADGKTLVGQNIDWFPHTPMDLVKITYPDGTKQLALVLWGIAEYTLNAAEFGMCANGTWASFNNYTGNIPVGCYLPKAMRQKNIAAAMEVLQNAARGLAYYHLASSDEIIGIESTQDDYQIIRPEKEVIVHTNHYLTERFKKFDLVQTLIPDSLQRIETIKKLIAENYGRLTLETMANILADHTNYPYSICRHISENDPYSSETLASFIMVPEAHTMYIAYGNPCQCDYIEYHL